MDQIDDKTRTELEAAAFRTLVAHLRERTDVQNIDLMNLAGFCRNCLSEWYRAAAGRKGVALSDPRRARSSTVCPMTSGASSASERGERPSRRPPSPRSNPSTEFFAPLALNRLPGRAWPRVHE